jgi:putative transposase
MPRIARIVAVGYPHHITQRGNYRQDIFTNDTDREIYLDLLIKESKQYDIKLLAYCFMTNHVHLIVVPNNEGAMGNVFKYVNMKYSQYYNKKIGTGGHLFQGRFFSCVMDELHTMICTRYIERNPVRANIIQKPCDWKWSSARIHCDMEQDKFGANDLFKYIELPKEEWRSFIEHIDNPLEIEEIQKQTRRGRPLARQEKLKQLEKSLNRKLLLKPQGRPKKK